MKRLSWSPCLLVMLSLFAPQSKADTLTLNAGQQLVVDFSLNAAFTSSLNISLLTFGLGSTACNSSPNACNSVGNITTSLYDGSTLLGTYTYVPGTSSTASFAVAAFQSATGLLTGLKTTVVDTTSLANGTIDGRLVTTISSGSLSGLQFGTLPTDTANLNLGIGAATASNQWYGYGGWLYSSYSASVTDAPLAATPEPSSLLLMLLPSAGAAGMAIRRRLGMLRA